MIAIWPKIILSLYQFIFFYTRPLKLASSYHNASDSARLAHLKAKVKFINYKISQKHQILRSGYRVNKINVTGGQITLTPVALVLYHRKKM